MPRIRSYLFAAVALLQFPFQSIAQVPEAATDEPLRLYMDCSGLFCDPDFFRTEIDFVSHVRDRQDADIQLLVTQQQTGAGGRAHTLTFAGQRGPMDCARCGHVAGGDERTAGKSRRPRQGHPEDG